MKGFKQYITEIFDNPEKWKWMFKDKWQWKASFTIEGINFYVDIYAFQGGGVSTTWIIEFNRITEKGKQGTQEVINDGKFQFKVFSTVKDVVFDVLRHRLILTYRASVEGIDSDKVIQDILNIVEVPY